MQLGNKWREIANQISGRTESQVKNRFKLILRREHIQQKTTNPDELKLRIIPGIIEGLRLKHQKGELYNSGQKANEDDCQSFLVSTI